MMRSMTDTKTQTVAVPSLDDGAASWLGVRPTVYDASAPVACTAKK